MVESQVCWAASSCRSSWSEGLLPSSEDRIVYGPKETGSIPLRSIDGSLLTDNVRIQERPAELFQVVLNQYSKFDTTVMDELPQWPTASHLDEVLTPEEVQRAVNQMSTGKAPGTDGIPSDVIKYGGKELLRHLSDLFTLIWCEESVPQDIKEALVVHIYKHKGDRAVCQQSPRHISVVSWWPSPFSHPAKQTRTTWRAPPSYWRASVASEPAEVLRNNLLSQTDTGEVSRAASRSLHGIYWLNQRTRLITVGDRCFPVAGSCLWNSLPHVVTSAPTLAVFRKWLKTYLFSRSFAL